MGLGRRTQWHGQAGLVHAGVAPRTPRPVAYPRMPIRFAMTSFMVDPYALCAVRETPIRRADLASETAFMMSPTRSDPWNRTRYPYRHG